MFKLRFLLALSFAVPAFAVESVSVSNGPASASVALNLTAMTLTVTYANAKGVEYNTTVQFSASNPPPEAGGNGANQVVYGTWSGNYGTSDPPQSGTHSQELFSFAEWGQWYKLVVSIQLWPGNTSEYEAGSQTVYFRSTTSGGAEAGKQMTWQIAANTGVNPVTWVVVKVSDGSVVTSTVQAAGAGETTLTASGLPAGAVASDYVLKFWLPALKFDTSGGSWVTTTASPTTGLPSGDETVFTATPTTAPTSANVIPTGTTPSPATNIPVATPSTVPNVAVSPSGTGGAVWNTSGGGVGLTDNVYKEGVDKIVNSQTVGTGHLSTLANAGKSAAAADAVASAKGYGGTGTGAGTGAQAKTDITSGYFMGNGTISGAGTIGAGNELPMKLVTSLGTWDFDPAKIPRLVQVMAWIKAMFAWILTAGWSYWLFNHFRELTGVGAVPQLRGHDVFAGTGGQASALGNAVVWTTLLLSLPVAYTAMLNSAGLTMPTISPVLTIPMDLVAGMGDAGQIGLHLISLIVPWSTVVLCLAGPVLVSAFSIPIYMSVQAAVRWLIA